MDRKNIRKIAMIVLAGMIFMLPLKSEADPTVEVTYSWSEVTEGIRYEYGLSNTSNPLLLYQLELWFGFLDPIADPFPVLEESISSPINWDCQGIFPLFITWYSNTDAEGNPAAPIQPGDSLEGFIFISKIRLGSLPYIAYFYDPEDPSGDPSYAEGTSFPISTPEPATLLLLGCGLIGLGYLRRRKTF